MGSRTISLEDSAYDKLREAKRPGESFSDVIHRILAGPRPSILGLQGLLDRRAGLELAETVARMKAADIEAQKKQRPARGR